MPFELNSRTHEENNLAVVPSAAFFNLYQPHSCPYCLISIDICPMWDINSIRYAKKS